MPTTIGVIEDDKLMAQLLSAWLEPYGYECLCFESGEDFLAFDWQSSGVVLLLVDWRLPGISGIQLIKKLVLVPDCPAIIFVTAVDRAEDLAHALHLGADDFVSKPVNKSVLLARVRALMRRRGIDHKSMDPALEVNLLASTLEVENRQGDRCKLSAAQYRALEFFLRHEGQVVSRSSLSVAVWGESETGRPGRALDLLVSRLRLKLDALPGNPLSIVSHYGVGYACCRELVITTNRINAEDS